MSALSDGPRANADPVCFSHLALNCPVIDMTIDLQRTNSSHSSKEVSWLFALHDFDSSSAVAGYLQQRYSIIPNLCKQIQDLI